MWLMEVYPGIVAAARADTVVKERNRDSLTGVPFYVCV